MYSLLFREWLFVKRQRAEGRGQKNLDAATGLVPTFQPANFSGEAPSRPSRQVGRGEIQPRDNIQLQWDLPRPPDLSGGAIQPRAIIQPS
jgi:hypothetical protein